MARKIFIDGGANVGQSARSFLAEWPNSNEYEVFCFEPSRGENIKNSLKALSEQFNNVQVIPAAIWVKDEEITFYDEERTSSSVIKEKLKGVKGISVKAIDLSEWIKDNFSDDDEIILKLDIEGAEYEVLEKLVQEGVTYSIDKVFIEIHGSKCGKTLQESKDLLSLMRSVGHKLYMWEGETFEYDSYEACYYTDEVLEKLHHNWTKRGFDRVVQERKTNERKA